jgi:raffinose/stachyose/melibiose transport system substrate-binding protein
VAKKKHILGAIAVALPMLLLVSACAPGGSTASGDQAAAVSKDISGKDITLKLLDFWQKDKWVDATIKEFEKEHPNVTIKRTTQDWGQVVNTLNLRLADANGPDVATVNNGWQSLGTLAQGGRVLNLDKYADLYGWNKEFPETQLRQVQFTPDGKEMGTGSLYATPAARSSLIGLYYNKDILDSLGIPVPKTLDEFEKACAAVKAAGKVPIVYGSQDKGSSTAILFALQNLTGSVKNISDFVYSQGSVPIADTGLTEAATTVKKYADNGWFTPNYAGIQYNDAGDKFLHGEGAFRFDYTGSLPFTDAERPSFGYVQLPQTSGSDVVGTGAASGVLSISSKSKNPDAAAAFLDFLASKKAAQLAVDTGYLPLLHTGLTPPKGNPVFATEVAGQQSLDEHDGYVPYFDWSTPSMLDTLGGQLQEVLAGKSTPQQLTEAGQKDYDAFQADRKKG